MNKTENRQDAINELEDTGHIEILDTQLDEKEYREIIEKFKQTKSDFLKETENYGYSEFMSGVVLGIVLMEEERKDVKKLGKRNWGLNMFKKWNK